MYIYIHCIFLYTYMYRYKMMSPGDDVSSPELPHSSSLYGLILISDTFPSTGMFFDKSSSSALNNFWGTKLHFRLVVEMSKLGGWPNRMILIRTLI